MFRICVFATALLLVGAVGCKRSPAYVGTYQIVVDDAMKKQIDTAKAMMSKIPQGQRDAIQKQIDSLAQIAVTINPDGTFSQTNPGGGHNVEGTYTADGDTLTMSGTDPQSKQSVTSTLTFHAADQTLTMNAGGGTQITLKKK